MAYMRKVLTIASLLLVVALASGCQIVTLEPYEPPAEAEGTLPPSPIEEAADDSILGIARDTPELGTLVAALAATDLPQTLAGEGPFTVFAPVDSAFDEIDVALLLDDPDALQSVLEGHLVVDAVDVETLLNISGALTFTGNEVVVAQDSSGDVYVNNALVTTANITATNGIIHLIDSVIDPTALPPVTAEAIEVEAAETLTETAIVTGTEAATDTEAVTGTEAATDADALSDTSIIVDEIVVDVQEAISATDAVTAAETITETMVDTATDVMTETEEMTGVNTITDSDVVTDSEVATGTVESATDEAVGETVVDDTDGLDVVEIVAVTEGLGALTQALVATELNDILRQPGPFTIFAPTDAAFAALPEGALDALLADPDALEAALNYHLVVDAVDAETLVGYGAAFTFTGDTVTITQTSDGTVLINDAIVIAADIEASNGIVHVIDTVLLPPQ